MHVISKFLVCALLAIIPLTGLKMICVAAAPASATAASAPSNASDECGEMCPRKPAHKAPAPGCVLVPDSCTIELLGVVAVLPLEPPATLLLQPRPFTFTAQQAHRAAALSPPSPPPKS